MDDVSESVANEASHRQMRWVAEKLSSASGPSFVSVAPREPIPFDTEPDDLIPIYLVCCSEDLKVVPRWKHALYCYRCGARHDCGLAPPKLEQAVVAD